VAATLGLSGLLVVVLLEPASAHEQRSVGAYHFVVGWANEPIYAGERNAALLILTTTDGRPVNTLGDSLKLQVGFGTQSINLPLELTYDPDTGEGTPGEYLASFIPTVPGNYTFHFTGRIGKQKIDETFAHADGLESVDDPSAVEFPVKEPPVSQVAALAQRLSTRLDAAQRAQERAQDSANGAKTIGYVGIAVGAVAVLGVGVLAVSRRRGGSRVTPARASVGERS